MDWNFSKISHNTMNQPYYISNKYKKELSKLASNTILEELITISCHPSQHPANYLSTDDFIDHPLTDMTKLELIIL